MKYHVEVLYRGGVEYIIEADSLSEAEEIGLEYATEDIGMDVDEFIATAHQIDGGGE